MTPREKLHALAQRLQHESERNHELGIRLLERANEGLLLSQGLLETLPRLTDEQCKASIDELGPEDAAEMGLGDGKLN